MRRVGTGQSNTTAQKKNRISMIEPPDLRPRSPRQSHSVPLRLRDARGRANVYRREWSDFTAAGLHDANIFGGFARRPQRRWVRFKTVDDCCGEARPLDLCSRELRGREAALIAVTTIGGEGAARADAHVAAVRGAARNQGVDAFRYLLAYLVVLLHSLPGNAVTADAVWPFWLSSICRAAVPFFFVASGYFLKPAPGLAAVLKPLKRLLPVYAFWFAIYAIWDVLQGGLHQLPHPGD